MFASSSPIHLVRTEIDSDGRRGCTVADSMGEYDPAMDRDQLRATQKPIKDRYREAPETALITLRAEGALDETESACSVATGRELVPAGLHPGTGGPRPPPCSVDTLLAPLLPHTSF